MNEKKAPENSKREKERMISITDEQIQNGKAEILKIVAGMSGAEKLADLLDKGNTLIAVMDLVDGYPEKSTAFIGFFMMKKALQGQGLGSSIIEETAAYLKATGKTAIRLAIDKDNPQSNHFWNKNGFQVFKQVERGGWTVLVAEKAL